MRGRERLLVVALAIVAAVSMWRLRSPPDLTQRPVEGLPTEIDYYLSGARITSTDEDGRLAYRLISPRIEHFITDDSSLAQTPHLVVFRDSAPPWQLWAESGLMPADGITIDLQGEVTVTRDAGPETPETRAVTREVTVNTVEKTARTHEPVTVRHGNWDIEGIGMRIDLRNGQVEMSSVKGIYAPQS